MLNLEIFAVIMLYVMVGSASAQVSIDKLLNEICAGATSPTPERQLESRGAEDSSVRNDLSDRLPSLLLETKNVNATVLLAQLAGALKLVSTIPALSELLRHDNNKSMTTDLHRSAELIDDPVGAALANIGEPSVPRVSDLLRSPDSQIRSRAVRVLTKIGTSNALNALRSACRSEQDAQVRALMLAAVAEKSSRR